MITALITIGLGIWLFCAFITWIIYMAHKVTLMNNKYKLTLGVICSLIAWPWVMWNTLSEGEL